MGSEFMGWNFSVELKSHFELFREKHLNFPIKFILAFSTLAFISFLRIIWNIFFFSSILFWCHRLWRIFHVIFPVWVIPIFHMGSKSGYKYNYIDCCSSNHTPNSILLFGHEDWSNEFLSFCHDVGREKVARHNGL